MKWWPLTGIKNYFTEKKDYSNNCKINRIIDGKIFKKSLFVFVIDVGNSNLLNFTIKALKAPQFNIHRFGIFFTETPRHADLLVVLGPLNNRMKEPLVETIAQMPKRCGVLIINEDTIIENNMNDIEIPDIVAEIDRNITPDELLSLLLEIAKGDFK